MKKGLPTTSIQTPYTNNQPQGPSGPGARALRALPGERARTLTLFPAPATKDYPQPHETLFTTSILTQNTNIQPQGLRPWGQGPSGPARGAGPNPNPMSRTSNQRLPTTTILIPSTNILSTPVGELLLSALWSLPRGWLPSVFKFSLSSS